MNRIAAVVVAGAMISGCSSVDRISMTQLEPRQDGSISYRVDADETFYDVRDPEEERTRLEWLAYLMRENNLCPGGYDVVDRRPVKKHQGPAGALYTIWYDVRCI